MIDEGKMSDVQDESQMSNTHSENVSQEILGITDPEAKLIGDSLKPGKWNFNSRLALYPVAFWCYTVLQMAMAIPHFPLLISSPIRLFFREKF